MAVVLSAKAEAPNLLQLCSFIEWLPKHAALVQRICAKMPAFCNYQLWAASGEMLQQALQTAAAPAPAAAAEALPQAAAAQPITVSAALASISMPGKLPYFQQQQQQQQDLKQRHPQQQQPQCGWRLASFSCNLPGAAAMLDALPAHSLTHLELGVSHSGITSSAEQVAAALARLSNLQRLIITTGAGCRGADFPDIPRTYLKDGVALLPKLTSLTLPWSADEEPVQQLLSQPLPRLQQLLLTCCFAEVNLSHLTQLQELGGEHGASLVAGSVLPAQLKRLQLIARDGTRMLSSVLPLQQLQQLRLEVYFPEQQPLLQLAQLPALQHLALHYANPTAAVGAAAAWPLLPQLQELVVGDRGPHHNPYPTPQQFFNLLGAVTACSALTKLQLGCSAAGTIEFGYQTYPDNRQLEVCASLASMTSLQELQLSNMWLVPGDAAALTALSALTNLSFRFHGDGEGVDSVAVCALASCLKQLRSLEFHGCGADFRSPNLRAVLGQLQQLTELRITNDFSHTCPLSHVPCDDVSDSD
jgi:hypothetical protein